MTEKNFKGRAVDATVPLTAEGVDMKKQALKVVTLLTLVVTLALASAAISVSAAPGDRVMAKVPFEFIVGDKTLPAGEYTIARAFESSDSAIAIRSKDGKANVFRLTNPLEANRSSSKAKLVFHRYGNRYFLSEVWTGMSGRRLNKSHNERAIERELAAKAPKREVAQNAPEVITLIATLQ